MLNAAGETATGSSGFRAPEDVKAQWAARPPMFGPAPLANRRPVTDAPGKLAKPRVPAPLGEPLWPFPAQRYDADVVTGLALNYREFSHRAFVGTLRRAGYTGDITLITEPRQRLQRGCEAYLRKSGVVAYGLVPDCSASSGGNIKHKTCKWREGQPPLPLAIIRHALYLAIAKTYSPRSMFYVADYRDTFFQADPFARVVERRGGGWRASSCSSSQNAHWLWKSNSEFVLNQTSSTPSTRRPSMAWRCGSPLDESSRASINA